MMLWKLTLRLLLLVIAHVANTANGSDGCKWKVQVTKPANVPFNLDSSIVEAPISDITENDIDGIDLYHIRESTKVGLNWLPYCLVLSLQCTDNALEAILGQQIASDFDAPLIKLCEHHGETICRIMPTVVIDLSRYTAGGPSCVNRICEPVWMAPLTMYGSDLVLDLQIYTHLQAVPQQVFLPLSGYHNLTQNAMPFPSLSVLQQELTYIPRSSPSMVALVGTDLLALTTDEFDNSLVIQLSDVLDLSDNDVCTCETWAPSVAASTDRIILAVKTGIYEIQGSFHKDGDSYNSSISSRRLGSICVSDISLPAVSGLWPGTAVLTGGCQDRNSVYKAQISYRNAEPLTIVTNSSYEVTTQICQAWLADIVGCQVLDIASLPAGSTLLLVEINFFNGSQSYAVVEESESLFNLTSVLPVSESTIQHMSVTPFVSKWICLWGNILICSSNPGHSSWTMVGDFHAETVVTTQFSSDGYISTMTNTSKVYVGHISSDQLTLLYPSTAWEMLYRMKPGEFQAPLHTGVTLVSLFFDNINILQLLHLNGTEIVKYQLPYQNILHYVTYMETLRNESLTVCPIQKVWVQVPDVSNYSRIQELWYRPPKLLSRTPSHNRGSLLAYSSVVYDVEHYRKQHLQGAYEKYYDDFMNGWQEQGDAKQKILQSDALDQGIQISREMYHMGYAGNVTGLPDVMFLDVQGSLLVDVYVQIRNNTSNFDISSVDLAIASSDSDLVSINTISTELFDTNIYKFQVSVNDTELHGELYLRQAVGITLQLTSENCQQTPEFFHTDIVLGCPPNKRVTFDWQASKLHIQQADLQQIPVDCYKADPELPCFYYNNDFYPYFLVHDLVTGDKQTYSGNYTLKVVGGGSRGPQNIHRFTDHEIESFNINKYHHTHDHSLVFSPQDEIQVYKDNWTVYCHKTHGISWLCQSGSPCASVPPDFPHSPHYYFLLQFSNRYSGGIYKERSGDVDDSSRCDLTFEFVVHVHGLPLSVQKTGTFIFIFTICLLCCYVALYWICHRQEDKVYAQFIQKIKQCICSTNIIHPSDKPEDSEIELETTSTLFNVPHIVYSSDVKHAKPERSKEYLADCLPSESSPSTSKLASIYQQTSSLRKDDKVPHISSPDIQVSSYEEGSTDYNNSTTVVAVSDIGSDREVWSSKKCKSVQFVQDEVKDDTTIRKSQQQYLPSIEVPEFQFHVQAPSRCVDIEDDAFFPLHTSDSHIDSGSMEKKPSCENFGDFKDKTRNDDEPESSFEGDTYIIPIEFDDEKFATHIRTDQPIEPQNNEPVYINNLVINGVGTDQPIVDIDYLTINASSESIGNRDVTMDDVHYNFEGNADIDDKFDHK